MKLKEIYKLTEVFVKKGRNTNTSIKYKILGYDKSKSGKSVYIILENGMKFQAYDLTDVSCDFMECGNCKYHKRKND